MTTAGWADPNAVLVRGILVTLGLIVAMLILVSL